MEAAGEAAIRSLGEHHPEVSEIRRIRAWTLARAGDLEGSKKAFQEALRVAQEHHTAHPEIIAALHSGLGAVLTDAGELELARDMLEAAVEMNLALRDESPSGRASLARDRGNLAVLLGHMGELPRAIELTEQSLETFVDLFGEGGIPTCRSAGPTSDRCS